MSRTGGRRASGPAGPGGTNRRRAAGVPLAGALVGAGLLALAVVVGEGRGAAAWGPADGGSASSLRAGGGGDLSRAGVEDMDLDRAYLDGPPPGHTGGFDEPTCRACHFDRPLDPEGGELRLEGVPGRFAADSAYEVSVVLTHDDMRRAGFQLAARWRTGEREGCAAGELEPGQEGVEAVAEEREASAGSPPSDAGSGDDGRAGPDGCEVVYVQHAEAGTGPVEEGVARWTVRWRAPARAEGPVAFHVAANAANDDASEFGDRIYASEAVTRPR